MLLPERGHRSPIWGQIRKTPPEEIQKTLAMSDNFPKISVITPSFNQGSFLQECIDSILSQNYPNLEYIIIDGGSTDNSVDIIKKYEKYLTYWESKPDGGQYEAINQGFKMSTGEVMAWLNSDDKYHHHAFFLVSYLFSTYKDLEWITGRNSWWDEQGGIKAIDLGNLPQYSLDKFLKQEYDKPWIQQESTFWRRSLWDRAGGYIRSDLCFAGDLELWFRFFHHSKLFSVDALLGGYRYHQAQKMANSRDLYLNEANAIVKQKPFQGCNYDEYLLSPVNPLKIDVYDYKQFISRLAATGLIVTSTSEMVTDFFLNNIGCIKHVEQKDELTEASCDGAGCVMVADNATETCRSERSTAPLRTFFQKLKELRGKSAD